MNTQDELVERLATVKDKFPPGSTERNAVWAAIVALRAADNRDAAGVWRPIETAPKDNARPLYLARFNPDTGELQGIDWDGSWEAESEGWEMPQIYYVWKSAHATVDEPTHWAYQDEPIPPTSSAVPAGEAVAYLDIGVGGYLDLGTEKNADELFKLPPGRHMLGIIGTYGVDGYKANPPAAEAPAAVQPAPSAPVGVDVGLVREFRDYVSENAPGLSHHHPIWVRIADALALTAPQPADGGAVAWRTRHRDMDWSFTTRPHPRDLAAGIWEPLYIHPPAVQVQQEAVAWCSLKNGKVFRVGLTKGALGIDTPLYLHPAAGDKVRELVEKCRAALAEEMAQWDIDPPIAHVKEAHDACVAWLAQPQSEEAS